MYISLLFWLALALPGYALVRRWWPAELAAGPLGVLALSGVAVLGLLSPVAILCYVLHLPMWVFSGACAISVLVAACMLVRDGGWRDLGKLLREGVSIEAGLLVVAVVLTARVGAFVDGDAVVHLSRIRFILDNGFSNADPFVAASYFFPIYHTNIEHALYAACTQLTGVPHVEAWYASAPVGLLLAAAGAYYMAWHLFERRWAAWVAVLFVLACRMPIPFLIYPNKVASLWLVPMMIGFAVQAARSRCGWAPSAKLAIGSLLLGQVHNLYAAFAGALLAPVLIALFILRLRKATDDRWQTLACSGALLVALPFCLVSLATAQSGSSAARATAPTKRADVRLAPAASDKPKTASTKFHRKGAFKHFDNGWIMRNPSRGELSQLGWRAALLLLGGVIALRGSRRREVAILLGIMGTAAAILYIPPLCTAAVGLLRAEWVLDRLSFIFFVGFVGLVPAVMATLLESIVRPWWAKAGVGVLIAALAIPAYAHRVQWQTHLSAAIAPVELRQHRLNIVRRLRDFCEKNVPKGVTLLVDQRGGPVLVMIHDCHIVAAELSSSGVSDMPQRRRDVKRMLASTTPWDVRRQLLRQYNIRHYYITPATLKVAQEWTPGHIRVAATEPGFVFLTLDVD